MSEHRPRIGRARKKSEQVVKSGYRPLAEAAEWLPGSPSAALVGHWVLRGVMRGGRRIRLKSVRIDETCYTTEPWCREFVEELRRADEEHLDSLPASMIEATPLTSVQRAVWKILEACPIGEAMTGAQIIRELSQRSPAIYLGQSELTSRVIPALRERGVRNKRGCGYYIDPAFRSLLPAR